jgi:Domain of unknown function (DUF6895)
MATTSAEVDFDLGVRLGRCLDVASRAVEVLGPEGYQGSDGGEEVSAEKVIAEAGLLLLVSAPAVAGSAGLTKLHTQLAERLIPFARSDRAQAGICLTPARALGYGTAHICLQRLGYRDAEFDLLLSRSLAGSAARSGEAAPHRQLELDWLRALSGVSENGSQGAERCLAARSILAQPVDLLFSGRSDMYAFTHVLMFLTGLGVTRGCLPRPRQYLALDAEALLAAGLDDHDYDVAAELLLTWPLLGLDWSPVATFAFSVLTQVEDRAGFLPSPMTRVDRYETLDPEERPRYALATAYHAVFAMGLLCAMSIHPGPRPAADLTVGGGEYGEGAAAAILHLLDRDEGPRHWREWVASLSRVPDSIAPVLLTMLLRRAAARKDMRLVSAGVEIADRYDLGGLHSAQQARELLSRVSELTHP